MGNKTSNNEFEYPQNWKIQVKTDKESSDEFSTKITIPKDFGIIQTYCNLNWLRSEDYYFSLKILLDKLTKQQFYKLWQLIVDIQKLLDESLSKLEFEILPTGN